MLIDPNRVIFRPAPFAGSPIAAMTARRRDRSARRPTGPATNAVPAISATGSSKGNCGATHQLPSNWPCPRAQCRQSHRANEGCKSAASAVPDPNPPRVYDAHGRCAGQPWRWRCRVRQAPCAAPTARPAARATKIASAVVRLWVAGRRSGRGRCRAAPGPAFFHPPPRPRPRRDGIGLLWG